MHFCKKQNTASGYFINIQMPDTTTTPSFLLYDISLQNVSQDLHVELHRTRPNQIAGLYVWSNAHTHDNPLSARMQDFPLPPLIKNIATVSR